MTFPKEVFRSSMLFTTNQPGAVFFVAVDDVDLVDEQFVDAQGEDKQNGGEKENVDGRYEFGHQ